MCFGFAIKGRATINLPDDDQRKLNLWFIVPASNGGLQSTARQTFKPECMIVFVFAINGRVTSICRTTIRVNCVLFRAIQKPINGKRALHQRIEGKQSRDT